MISLSMAHLPVKGVSLPITRLSFSGFIEINGDKRNIILSLGKKRRSPARNAFCARKVRRDRDTFDRYTYTLSIFSSILFCFSLPQQLPITHRSSLAARLFLSLPAAFGPSASRTGTLSSPLHSQTFGGR